MLTNITTFIDANSKSYISSAMIVGERVLERMAYVGISQAELARRVGVAQPTINNLIHRSKKGSTHLHKVARELGTTPAYLSGETSDPLADAPPAPELDRDEWAWVEYWRALDVDGRDAMVRVVKLLTGRPVQEQAGA